MMRTLISLRVSVAGFSHGSMRLTLLLWFLLMNLVIGTCYNNVPLGGLTSLEKLCPPNGIKYSTNFYFNNIFKGMEQNGVLALSRRFGHFMVNYGDSEI